MTSSGHGMTSRADGRRGRRRPSFNTTLKEDDRYSPTSPIHSLTDSTQLNHWLAQLPQLPQLPYSLSSPRSLTHEGSAEVYDHVDEMTADETFHKMQAASSLVRSFPYYDSQADKGIQEEGGEGQ
mmetsp:Transcript_26220/g.36057  ORF Transcript_26220/g.36057 Transcript_26220/m.36057 type:complete len:125 (-) Transcript_26220:174-548(-)